MAASLPQTPTPILDAQRVQRNIAFMAARAERAGALFRPHFKTHQSAAVGEWFRDHGVRAITVSSLQMAEYFAAHGWRDITVAFPFNPLELARATTLAAQVELGLLVQSGEVVQELDRALQHPVQIWIKIDAGYGRAGIRWDRIERVTELALQIAGGKHIHFAGLLVHSGHSYHQSGVAAAQRIHAQCLERLLPLQCALLDAGLEECRLSVGDTPCCSMVEDFGPVDELRPGNFVFYDLQQRALGACGDADLALALACPVVGLDSERGRLLLYGGSVHLSRDRVALPSGAQAHGLLSAAPPWRGGWPATAELGVPWNSAVLTSLSQEHGLVELPPGEVRRYREGDLVLVFPAHSCLSCDPHSHYLDLDGARHGRFRLA